MPINYQQTADREIHDRVRKKHQTAIQELKRLNFEEYGFFGESVQAFGFIPLGLSGFLGALIALFKEVAKVEGNLDVTVFNVLMASREYATYAGPFGLGVKFYTSFKDGTFIITANFESPAIADDREKLYKYAVSQTVVSAWLHHKQWVDKLCQDGKQKIDHLSFADFLQMAQREDNYLLKHKNTLIARDSFPSLPSWIISISLWAAFVLLFMFLPSLAHYLYPLCWFVRNMDKPTLIQNVLLLSACLTTSWILARKQTTPALIEGAGTKFYGQTPTPDAQAYISTKWLMFMMVPVIPVGSYLITEEHPGGHPDARYSMKLLDKLDWAQVRETLWKSKFGILLLVIIMLSLGVWSFRECM